VNSSAGTRSSSSSLLSVRDIEVSFHVSRKKRVKVLNGVSFSIEPGECLSLVGESGCGKTVTAMAIMGLLPFCSARREAGRILFKGEELTRKSERALRSIRGSRISMIFQDAFLAMNPYLRVSEQLIEGYMHHTGASEKDAIRKATALLDDVGIPDAGDRIHDYPHSFSGGMLQRIMIAMALMTSPELIIADEPTSALDVTIQAQTLELLDALRSSSGSSLLLITHDLGVVAGLSDRTAVMYAGRIVEDGPTDTLLRSPAHPYMKALLRSNPTVEPGKHTRIEEIPGSPPLPSETAALGCPFAPRCEKAVDTCLERIPSLNKVGAGHKVACRMNNGY